MPINQDSRLLAIGTALGPNVLGARSVTIHEQISRLFHIEVELSSETNDINLDAVIGFEATVRIQVAKGATRFFNGFVSRLVQSGADGPYTHYSATIVPWLWFLTRTADCRIFQALTAPAIIEAVFKAHGFDDYELKLSGTYAAREYCVQYRETDFNFVSRLMEQEGIYYFFTHTNGKHVLVLADSISASSPQPGYETVIYSPIEKGSEIEREVITDWVIEKQVQATNYALNDFDFIKPKTSLSSSARVSRAYGSIPTGMYDYPGEYVDHGEGERLAQVRLDELQSQYEVLRGQATARGLAAGSTFTLKSHPQSDQNREYLVTGVALRADAGEFGSTETASEEKFCSSTLTAIDSKQAYRPERLTPKPVVQGPQTAMVVGTSGEEIYTDQYGRVKLLFPWDRYSKADENSSCWVRVSQAWAGSGWGAIYTPRIGQEVIVEFLEGDPDRPIVTGRVYNASAMPPYALPANKTKSTLKSNSSKGGGGFNEIRFEDLAGSEQIFINGQRDLDIQVKHNAYETIGNDSNQVVGKDKLEHVKNNRHETVDSNHIESIATDRNLSVGGKEAKTVGGSLSLKVTGDVAEAFLGNHAEVVTSDYYLKADNIVIEGMTSVTIKVGQSFIAIDQTGISIGTDGTLDTSSTGTTTVKSTGALSISTSDAATVKSSAAMSISSDASATINSTAAMTVSSSAETDIKAPQISVKGDAMVTIKGGMVMIN